MDREVQQPSLRLHPGLVLPGSISDEAIGWERLPAFKKPKPVVSSVTGMSHVGSPSDESSSVYPTL